MSRFVVVGHGRSPEGAGWGRLIDGADLVIRMWDWHWQPADDYGTRYDYGLIEIAPVLLERARQHGKRSPRLGWVGSQLYCGRRAMTLPARTEVIDQKRWSRIGRAMGGIGATGRLEFTRGTIAALWTIERTEIGDAVILVGFDNVRRGASLPLEQAFCPAYRANEGSYPFDGYVGGVAKYGNHDYAIEWPLLKTWADLHRVSLDFAEDIWTKKAAA